VYEFDEEKALNTMPPVKEAEADPEPAKTVKIVEETYPESTEKVVIV
jgi:hypothetical protein